MVPSRFNTIVERKKVSSLKIGFFDSGLGGVTVLSEALRRLPNENFVYMADTLHVPYGTKTPQEVLGYVKASVQTILKEDIKALVIACNTATSIAVAELRKEYKFPIIGMEPAVKPAVEMNRANGKRVLVLATPLTLKQSGYAALVSRVDDHGSVDSLPLPELVQYCEQLNFDRTELFNYFNHKLSSFNLDVYGTVVLGCTHYPFYKEILRELLPSHIQLIDGSQGTVKRLKQVLSERNLLAAPLTTGQLQEGHVTFLCTSQDKAYVHKMERALEIYAEHEKIYL
ncbi:glutamate racemase [Paenibacillus sp. EKM102P]|uniref:glutamate racemase n=1 Tax=Paenibacillus TaxID=44249 RepID=UPI000D31C792|nr:MULTISPECIES: glutamate racemase [Paenibacillus]KAF6616777.1 glutamate racemase [Paenibacillus sp. EKM101P]KAF6621728.1 glutamate racemase [Paenibacillus sp. EKM102P]KAF6630318.1 glutamate racemase [Paenibacillus sp. EKM10P]KAF6645569.1 glutamate racemase [Paenibacillus sp. EKM11P]PTU46200.1 glutamate racemase [Paenibacillus polymyxa]